MSVARSFELEGKLSKEINSEEDVTRFKSSLACMKLKYYIDAISSKISPSQIPDLSSKPDSPLTQSIVELIGSGYARMEMFPPKKGPRRYGNVASRDWHAALQKELFEGNIFESLKANLSSCVTAKLRPDLFNELIGELAEYFSASFGSPLRMDYGTGHELNFLAFFGGVVNLGQPYIADDFSEHDQENIAPEDALTTGLFFSTGDILRIFASYFDFVTRFIRTYNLEPAGSHGVWGLDDHFHLMYIFGSAQIVDIKKPDYVRSDVPTDSILDRTFVSGISSKNLYFRAIDFIYLVKRGNFYEHSPMLYDTTGVKTWHKIHRGMIKMYNVEVLSKFPVIQHFKFGKLYSLSPPATS